MKRIGILISVVGLVAFAISCSQQVEPTAQFKKSSATFAATSTTTAISATSKDSTTAVLTVNWNDPKYAIGLAKSVFTVYVSPSGTNFAKFGTKSFTGVLTGSLMGKDLNGIALKLGGSVGKSISLDVKVIAAQENNNEQLTSNTLTITFSPYGDLGLTTSTTAVTASAATSGNVADTLAWSVAFNGYSGVKSYLLQYAKSATSFASPTSVSVSALSKTYTQLDLNKIALGLGAAPGATFSVDFRVKAVNESKDTIYSNVVTVAVTTYVAYNSIGLIGDVTAGGWNVDTDMYRPDPINAPSNWTLTTYLTVATYGMQFRADDAWNTQWGGATFPSGTGTQSGGNIPLTTSGYYKVDFNAGTGAYNFTLLSPKTFSAVVITGDFNGWHADTGLGAIALTADGSGHIWTGTFSQTDATNGQLKIVGDGSDWYGDSTFPSGLGVDNGPNNISVPVGNYFVYFNDVSGEFFFGNTGAASGVATAQSVISLIGDFDGWPNDTTDPVLIQNPTNPYKWSAKIAITAGGAKFRANHGWNFPTDLNWGGTTFPNGVGVLNGGNIPVTTGNPQITINTATGEYTFTY